MKSMIVAVVIFAALVFANADLTEEQKNKLQENGKACIAESGVDVELIKKARQGTFTEDAKLEEFTFCLSKKTGFQNEAGEVQTEVIKTKLTGAINDPELADKLIAKCLVPQATGAKTAFSVFKCYFENTPTHITLF